MLQSHGRSSLHTSPLDNWLATQCVSFSSLSVPPTHWTAWLALCPYCLYVTSISIPSALEGEDKASCHGSPYVTHLTLSDATLFHCSSELKDSVKSLHFSHYREPVFNCQHCFTGESFVDSSPQQHSASDSYYKFLLTINVLLLPVSSPLTQIREERSWLQLT